MEWTDKQVETESLAQQLFKMAGLGERWRHLQDVVKDETDIWTLARNLAWAVTRWSITKTERDQAIKDLEECKSSSVFYKGTWERCREERDRLIDKYHDLEACERNWEKHEEDLRSEIRKQKLMIELLLERLDDLTPDND